MPTINVTAPDGSIIPVNAPDGATEQDAIAFAASVWKPQANQPQPTPQPTQSWSDVPGQALSNIPKSAANFAGGIYQAVRHPLDTGMNLWDAAAGGLHNMLPKGLTDAIEINPEAAQRAVKTADAVGGFYKDRYGSMEGLKKTLSTDPVGFAGDISTVLGIGAGALNGGASLASKFPALAGASDAVAPMVGALSTAQRYTNPVNAVAPVLGGVANASVTAGKNILGMTTGVGPESVSQAFTSGLGNKSAFWDNLTGKADMTDVLDVAKQNIQNMGAQKSAAYRSGMVDIRNDKSILDFDNIDKALASGVGNVTYKGQIKNQAGAQVLQNIGDEISTWKGLDPAEYHTPEGLDALMKKIGGIVESIPFEEKTARMAGSSVCNAIKGEISAQPPTYAKVMQGYPESSDLIKEIERALSLGNKAAADTSMRKLQSLSRNNVQTNYGNRLDLAKTLEQQGGNEILPAIAGQSMNSWTSRGLAGRMENLATPLAAMQMSNPWVLGAIPFQSPKAVGGALYGLGQASRPVVGALTSVSEHNPLSPEQMQALELLSYQTGRLPQGQ